ncbi:MAG: hypothetical protein GF401_10990 [Chitinivibrionales bacterium]|nr:hypothetical protein [Chitinivibrionales bacterium]
MKKMLLALHVALFSCLCALLYCSSEQPIAGTETGTETGTLTGSVSTADNKPVANAYVFLHPGFSPVEQVALNEIRAVDSTWTDNRGSFTFNPIPKGDYNVEIISGDSVGALLNASVAGRDTDSVSGVVQTLGSISGTVDSALLNREQKLYVYIPEIERITEVEPAGSFSFVHVPQSDYTFYVTTISGAVEAEHESVPVRKGERTILGSVGSLSGSPQISHLPAPEKPKGLKATVYSYTSIKLVWDSLPYVHLYYIYRMSPETGLYDLLDSTLRTHYLDSGLAEGTTCYYKVAAANDAGVSSRSEYESATTPSSQGYKFERKPDLQYTLTSYEISSSDEAAFNVSDNKISSFWSAWDTAYLDIVHLNAFDYADYSEEPSSSDDCGMALKSAYGDSGVYFFFEVNDDEWVDSLAEKIYGNDAVELMVDRRSAEELYTQGTPYFVNVDYSQLTQSYMQVQVRFGASEPSNNASINWFDQAMAYDSGLTDPSGFVEFNRGLTLDSIAAQWGIKIEIIFSPIDTPSVRRQEWLVPWDVWGGTPGIARKTAGSRFACAFGYNDMDSGAGNHTALRWRNRTDPYSTDVNPATSDTTSVDSWGDILLGPKLDK